MTPNEINQIFENEFKVCNILDKIQDHYIRQFENAKEAGDIQTAISVLKQMESFIKQLHELTA